MLSGPTILIIDDEIGIRRFLRIGLEAHSYSIIEASSGKEGLYLATVKRPSAVILDLGLPDMDGQEVLRQLRQWSSIPVLILSVRNEETEKISCFDNGADDYIVKPFAMGEFLARLRSALRRQVLPDEPLFVNGELTVDIPNRNVLVRGTPIQLSPTEYDLLILFVKNAGKVLTHRQIMKEIWGPSNAAESQSLRVYIRQLRKKLEVDPAHPMLLKTEQGIGYRMVLNEN
jgi:two-component system KDP operon response regulator KdpE